jgi:hypothetical protein
VSNASLTEVRPPRVHSVNNTRHLQGVTTDIALGYPTPTPRAP